MAGIVTDDPTVVISIVTTEPLDNNLLDGSRDTGSLTITSSTFNLTIQLGKGDCDPFNAILEKDGSTVSYTVSWSVSFTLARFDPASFDVDFLECRSVCG